MSTSARAELARCCRVPAARLQHATPPHEATTRYTSCRRCFTRCWRCRCEHTAPRVLYARRPRTPPQTTHCHAVRTHSARALLGRSKAASPAHPSLPRHLAHLEGLQDDHLLGVAARPRACGGEGSGAKGRMSMPCAWQTHTARSFSRQTGCVQIRCIHADSFIRFTHPVRRRGLREETQITIDVFFESPRFQAATQSAWASLASNLNLNVLACFCIQGRAMRQGQKWEVGGVVCARSLSSRRASRRTGARAAGTGKRFALDLGAANGPSQAHAASETKKHDGWLANGAVVPRAARPLAWRWYKAQQGRFRPAGRPSLSFTP